MRTIKIKLPFSSETPKEDRNAKLSLWAKAMLKSEDVNVIEEKHLDLMSYIIVENSKKKPEAYVET